jgi:hypothetical protein
MAIDPVTGALIGAGAQALTGIYGANEAANAQEEAAKRQADTARRNAILGIQVNEPLRYAGYNALNDINAFLGYPTSPYTTAAQLQTSQTPLTAKQVIQAMRGGAGFDQIAQMGTLGLGGNNGKFIKRLVKAGLTMDQITQLRNGPQQAGPAPAAPAAAGSQSGWDAIRNAPDYQFQLEQGTRNVGNSFAARGGAASGNALRALAQFNQGLADQGVDKFMQRRMNIVNGGTTATNNVQNAGNTYSNNLMDSQRQQGDARASGVLGTTNTLGNAIGDFMYGWGNRQNSGYNTNGFTPAPGMGITPWNGVPQQQPRPWNYLDSLRGVG